MKKRVLSLILAISMVVSMFPAMSLWASAEDINQDMTTDITGDSTSDPETTPEATETPGDTSDLGISLLSGAKVTFYLDKGPVTTNDNGTVSGYTANGTVQSVAAQTVITLTGTTSTNTVTIGTATDYISYFVVLDGLNIDVSAVSGSCAFAVQGGNTLNLTLTAGSENTLRSGALRPGLQVQNTNGSIAELVVGGTGQLLSVGGKGGAGIGGTAVENGNGYSGGNVTINSGKVIAYGNGTQEGISTDEHPLSYPGGGGSYNVAPYVGGGAGIGGGGGGAGTRHFGGNGGSLTVNGGVVWACGGFATMQGYSGGAGIGGGGADAQNGYSCSGGERGDVTINGGNVRVWSNYGAPGIGSGGLRRTPDTSKVYVVNGGSASQGVDPPYQSGQPLLYPVNSAGTKLIRYRVQVGESVQKGIKITSMTTQPALGYTYGLNDVQTDVYGMVYLWLPANLTNITLFADDGNMYQAASFSADGNPGVYGKATVSYACTATVSVVGAQAAGLSYAVQYTLNAGSRMALPADGVLTKLKPGDALCFYILNTTNNSTIYSSAVQTITQDSTLSLAVWDPDGDGFYQSVPTRQWTAAVTAQPAGYTYTAATQTAEISTPEGLAWLATVWGGSDNGAKPTTIKLTADVNMSAYIWAEPLFSGGAAFTGLFDGQGHTVSGLYSTSGGFAKMLLQGATVRNLNITSGYLTGWILADENYGTIENCAANGVIVSGSGASFVGSNRDGGIVANCYCAAKRIAADDTVTQCGVVAANGSLVTYCYALDAQPVGETGTGEVTECGSFGADQMISGISLTDRLNSWVQTRPIGVNSLWKSSSGGNGGYPVFDQAWSGFQINYNFTVNDNAAITDNGKYRFYFGTSEATKTEMTYDGVWRAKANTGTAFHIYVYDATGTALLYTSPDIAVNDNITAALSLYAIGANGTLRDAPADSWVNHRASSYAEKNSDAKILHIRTAEELALLAYEVDNGTTYLGWNIYLDQDLRLEDYIWNPIGERPSSSTIGAQPFFGRFNGSGHTIGGLFIREPSNYSAGLFATVGTLNDLTTGAYVRNLGIQDSYLYGQILVGSIAGTNWGDSLIENCWSSAELRGSVDGVGGIVGHNAGKAVSNCYFVDKVTAPSGSGGIAGYNYSAIKNCYTLTDTVSNASGLSGINYQTNGLIYGMGFSGTTMTDCASFDADQVVNQSTKYADGSTTVLNTALNSWVSEQKVESGFVLWKTAGGYPQFDTVWGGYAVTLTLKVNNANVDLAGNDYSVCYSRGDGNQINIGNPIFQSPKGTITVYVYRAGKLIYTSEPCAITGEQTLSFDLYSIGLGGTLKNKPTKSWRNVVTTQPAGYTCDAVNKQITISSPEGLAWLVSVNNTDQTYLVGYTVLLTADLDMSANIWDRPIGTSESDYAPFSSTFDGQGHTISGLYNESGSQTTSALFGGVGKQAKLMNVGLENLYNSSSTASGLLAIENNGTIQNCYISGIMTQGDTGFVLNNMTGGSIENCYLDDLLPGAKTKHFVSGTCDGVLDDCYAPKNVSFVNPAVATPNTATCYTFTDYANLHTSLNGWVNRTSKDGYYTWKLPEGSNPIFDAKQYGYQVSIGKDSGSNELPTVKGSQTNPIISGNRVLAGEIVTVMPGEVKDGYKDPVVSVIRADNRQNVTVAAGNTFTMPASDVEIFVSCTAKETGNSITAFSIANQIGVTKLNASGSSITVLMPVGTSVNTLKPSITVSKNAKVTPPSSLVEGSNTYIVTPEYGSARTWTVNIYVKRPVPTATFTPSGYDTGTLSGLKLETKYSVDGGATWKSTGNPNSGSCDISGVGPGYGVQLYQEGIGDSSTNSDKQTIKISRAATPVLDATNAAEIGGKGSINTTAVHEYSTDNKSWTAANGATQLPVGVYYVRVQATADALASAPQLLAIFGQTDNGNAYTLDFVADKSSVSPGDPISYALKVSHTAGTDPISTFAFELSYDKDVLDWVTTDAQSITLAAGDNNSVVKPITEVNEDTGVIRILFTAQDAARLLNYGWQVGEVPAALMTLNFMAKTADAVDHPIAPFARRSIDSVITNAQERSAANVTMHTGVVNLKSIEVRQNFDANNVTVAYQNDCVSQLNGVVYLRPNHDLTFTVTVANGVAVRTATYAIGTGGTPEKLTAVTGIPGYYRLEEASVTGSPVTLAIDTIRPFINGTVGVFTRDSNAAYLNFSSVTGAYTLVLLAIDENKMADKTFVVDDGGKWSKVIQLPENRYVISTDDETTLYATHVVLIDSDAVRSQTATLAGKQTDMMNYLLNHCRIEDGTDYATIDYDWNTNGLDNQKLLDVQAAYDFSALSGDKLRWSPLVEYVLKADMDGKNSLPDGTVGWLDVYAFLQWYNGERK